MTTTDIEVRQLNVFAELERAANMPSGSITMVGLSLTDPDMTYEDWTALGRGLGEVRRWTSWAIGDWYNFGEGLYNDDAAQASEPTREDRMDVLHRVTGLAPGTLSNYASICSRIPMRIRRVELDFSVHEPVAALNHEEQAEWLQRAVDEGWGRDELRQAIRDAKNPPSEDDEPEVLEPARSIKERQEDAWALAVARAQPTSDGGALIPPEPWHQVLEAMGEE